MTELDNLLKDVEQIKLSLDRMYSSLIALGASSSRGPGGGGGGASFTRADSVSYSGTVSVGNVLTGTYTYSDSDTITEALYPPYAEELLIAGTLEVGQTLTSTITLLVVPNGTAGTHTYRWYRCADDHGSSDTLIVGATSSTYLLQEADDGFYIRAEVDLKNSAGTVGDTLYSLHSTGVVSSLTFNPVTDIVWTQAFIPDAAFVTSWANRGTGSAAIQDGANALPSWDATQNAILFNRSNSERLLYTKGSPAHTAPYEMYLRFKLRTLSSNTTLLGFNNSIFLIITTAGAINWSGGTTSSGLITTNTWYSLRVIGDGLTSTIEINDAAPISVSASTVSPGSTTGRIGCSFSGTNFLDGWISHFFRKDTPGDATEQTNMWTYLNG